MSEYERVNGTIARVWDNATTNGRPYKVVELENGDRYSLWRKGDFEKVSKGDEIDFDYNMSGKFKNIERIYEKPKVEQEPPGNGPDAVRQGSSYSDAPGNNGGSSNGYSDNRNEQLLDMSLFKSACELVKGTKSTFEEKVDKAIYAVDQFKKYRTESVVNQELNDPLEPPESIESADQFKP